MNTVRIQCCDRDVCSLAAVEVHLVRLLVDDEYCSYAVFLEGVLMRSVSLFFFVSAFNKILGKR